MYRIKLILENEKYLVWKKLDYYRLTCKKKNYFSSVFRSRPGALPGSTEITDTWLRWTDIRFFIIVLNISKCLILCRILIAPIKCPDDHLRAFHALVIPHPIPVNDNGSKTNPGSKEPHIAWVSLHTQSPRARESVVYTRAWLVRRCVCRWGRSGHMTRDRIVVTSLSSLSRNQLLMISKEYSRQRVNPTSVHPIPFPKGWLCNGNVGFMGCRVVDCTYSENIEDAIDVGNWSSHSRFLSTSACVDILISSIESWWLMCKIKGTVNQNCYPR